MTFGTIKGKIYKETVNMRKITIFGLNIMIMGAVSSLILSLNQTIFSMLFMMEKFTQS